MKISPKKAAAYFFGGDFLALLTLSLAGYILLEKTGLFRLEPASLREIFFSPASKVLSILFAVNALGGLYYLFLRSTAKKTGYVFFFLAILVLVASLWVSILTRFEGSAVRAEGQTIDPFKASFIPQTLYMSDEGRVPMVSISLAKLHPEIASDMKGLKRVTADILYSSRTTRRVIYGKLRSGRPLITDWTFIRITDFGYTPRYVLTDLKGKVLETSFRYMKLFPPGAEDSFEAMFLGYQFYLKLYPDYVDRGGVPGTLSAVPRNPVYNIRIVRNKDIVYNGLLKPTEKVKFDDFIISVPEVRMWVEMSFVKDYGLFILPFGVLLLLAGAALIAARRG